MHSAPCNLPFFFTVTSYFIITAVGIIISSVANFRLIIIHFIIIITIITVSIILLSAITIYLQYHYIICDEFSFNHSTFHYYSYNNTYLMAERFFNLFVRSVSKR